MFEASKTQHVRGPAFIEKYFAGTVLDIGCGPDLVVPDAEPFDLAQGDANRIVQFLPPGSQYDCVHSSHCLEHMRDAPFALSQWWSLVKPGGHLILVVPHEDLYEQGVWPSMFNPDHKTTFRIGAGRSWSPVSLDLRALLEQLPGAQLVDLRIQDQGYDYSLRLNGIGSIGRALMFISKGRRYLMQRIGLRQKWLEDLLTKLEMQLGRPIDQTLGDALAQIQAVVCKNLRN
jgi:SAM-dependent methyltransferase